MNACVPAARATLLNVKLPLPSACVFLIGVFGSNWRYSATNAPASVVPVRFTISWFVSVVWPGGALGRGVQAQGRRGGGVVRMTSVTGAAAALTLPATSSAVAVIWYSAGGQRRRRDEDRAVVRGRLADLHAVGIEP